MKKITLFLFLFFSLALGAQTDPVYVLHVREAESDLTKYCRLLPDPHNKFSLEEIPYTPGSLFSENKLHQDLIDSRDPGFNGWVRLKIYNPADTARVICFVPSKDVDTGYVHWLEYGKESTALWGTLVKTKDRSFAPIAMTVRMRDTLTVIMQIRGDNFSTFNNKAVTVSISDPQPWTKNRSASLLFFGVFYGMLIGLVFYSFAVYFVVRQPIYLYFIAFSVSVLLFYIKENGIGAEFLWGNGALHVLDKYGNNLVFGPLAIFTGFTLCRKFISLEKFHPKINRVIAILTLIQLLPFLRLLIGYHELIRLLQNTLVVLTMALLVGVAVYMAWKKNNNAIIFLLVFFFAMTGITIAALRYSQLVPSNLFTQYAGQGGIGVTALAFSLAIGAQVRQINKAKRKAEKEAFEKTAALERLTQEQNRLLEQKVDERTKELQAAQAELLRQEKLASLGKLANRIAHEMQNPLNFVNNFSEVSLELLQEYKDAKTDEERAAILKSLLENQEKINQHGKRAAEIVRSMFDNLRERHDDSLFGDKNAEERI